MNWMMKRRKTKKKKQKGKKPTEKVNHIERTMKIFSEAYWQIPNGILLNGWLKTKTKHQTQKKENTKRKGQKWFSRNLDWNRTERRTSYQKYSSCISKYKCYPKNLCLSWVYIVYSVVCVRECVNEPASNVCHMFVKLIFALIKTKRMAKKKKKSERSYGWKQNNKQTKPFKDNFLLICVHPFKKRQRRTWTVQMHFQTLNSSSSISGNSTHFWHTLTQHDTEWNVQSFNGIDSAIEKNRE